MPIQVFVDDSGGKGQGPVLVFAGLISEAERWAAFSEEWKQCLETPPAIAYFKMSEAAGRRHQFQGWSVAKRNAKLLELARICNRLVEAVVHCGVDIQGLEEALATPHAEKPLNEPYFWVFQNIIHSVGYDLLNRGLKEEFEIIFDEHVIFAPRVKWYYPVFRHFAEPELQPILPVEPLFRSDKQFLPLQAADLFAWCFRRGTSKKVPTGYEWLLPELSAIGHSKESNFYSKERMLAIVEDSYKREITEEMVKKYRELLGLDERL